MRVICGLTYLSQGGLIVVTGDDNIAQGNAAVAKFQDFNTDPKAAMGVTYGFDPSLGGKFHSVRVYPL